MGLFIKKIFLELPCLLGNAKFYSFELKRPTFDALLNGLDPTHIITCYICKIYATSYSFSNIRAKSDPSTLIISPPHHSAHLYFIPCEANITIAESSGTVASGYKFPGKRMADVFLCHCDV
jgi:hypothetical protein